MDTSVIFSEEEVDSRNLLEQTRDVCLRYQGVKIRILSFKLLLRPSFHRKYRRFQTGRDPNLYTLIGHKRVWVVAWDIRVEYTSCMSLVLRSTLGLLTATAMTARGRHSSLARQRIHSRKRAATRSHKQPQPRFIALGKEAPRVELLLTAR